MAIVEAEGAPGINGLGVPAGDSGKQGIGRGPAVLQGLSGCGQDLHGILGVAPSRLHAHARIPSVVDSSRVLGPHAQRCLHEHRHVLPLHCWWQAEQCCEV